MKDLINGLRVFLERLKEPFVGRDEEAKVVVLTLLSREHCTFIGEPGCVTGDTIISDAEGRLYYIDDLVSSRTPGIHPINFPVYPSAKATELHVYDVPSLIEVTSDLGYSIKATYNHPVLTDRGWVEVKNLRPGDRILTLAKLPSPKSLINTPELKNYVEEGLNNVALINDLLAELLGFFMIYGSLSSDHVDFKLSTFNNRIIGLEIHRLVKELLGNDVCRDIMLSEEGLVIVRCYSTYLSKLLRILVLNDVQRGRIPRCVLESPKNVSAGFLRALFEVYSELGLSGHGFIQLKNLDLSLVKGIQILLLRYGILSRITNGGEGYLLEISGFENLLKFYREIGYISTEKMEKLKNIIKSYRESINDDVDSVLDRDYILDSVRSIQVINNYAKVYDFYIPSTHMFFTNGIVSHNTAKSALVRRAAELLNARFFKYLLTKFTEPAEIFGPLDIKALQDGKYVRITRGKLPEADIAFLDEIFKANSAILNALNTLLQERILYDGYNEIRVPLWSLFGASNEVPDDPEIEAFYDRFTLRHFVRPVSEDLWHDLLDKSWRLEIISSLDSSSYVEDKVLDINQLRELYKMVLNVDLSSVKSKLIKLLAVLESRGIHITDRRKGKLLKVIAAHSLINGKNTATEDDLIAVKYVVARDLEELEKVNTILSEELKTPYKYLRELNEIKANVKEILNYVSSLRNVESRFVEMRFREIYRDLEITKERIISLIIESGNKDVEKLGNEVISLIDSVIELIRGRIT